MIPQLIIGFTVEGSTDYRFFESIIQRTFENIAFECDGQIEILPIQFVEKEPGNFEDSIFECAKKASMNGIMVLCIHTDADNKTDNHVFKNKINPAFTKISLYPGIDVCKNLVPVVPVQMTESWMLADFELIKSELNTKKTDKELGLDKQPESYSDPKKVFKEVIRLSFENYPQRRKRPDISEFYQLLGQKIALDKLEKIPSFLKFRDNVRTAFVELKLLNPSKSK
ncbi:MAG TPA: DUF4276 family protein [Flavilitoribacter sp.]|nr:DUF4276 family protein [Flavilitoribacter sp.]HMQ88623.1 DUF4276 family protein [Flavilitoribacter sp.]